MGITKTSGFCSSSQVLEKDNKIEREIFFLNSVSKALCLPKLGNLNNAKVLRH